MAELLQQVQEKFRRIARTHHRVMDQRLSETGVYRSQHHILMFLSDHSEQETTQKKIAKALDISEAAVAVTLRKLEEGGYLVRRPEEEDRRSNSVCLTEKGLAVIQSSREIFRQVDEKMFEHFDAEQMKVFLSCLAQIEQNLQACLKEEPTGK